MTDTHISLPEYDSNPFIASLPPIQNQKSLYHALKDVPLFEEKERSYPYHIRKHCIARLARCFLPQSRQIDLADRFGMLLRQGYLGRDLTTIDFLHRLHNGIDRIQAGSLEASVRHQLQNTASSFALIGCSGVGKSTTMKKVLNLYPQTISHHQPFSLVQIVWLRLEAPSKGSVEQLCIDFFTEVDKLIGTDYLKRYGRHVKVSEMIAYMAHVAHLHGLGVLIIDEIQHLCGDKVSASEVLKFMVRLVNTIGVPLIPIGTYRALDILQGNFSQARRASGLGSLNWDRLGRDKHWNRFLKDMWEFQWTDPPTELTPELNTVFYDETQGVTDIAVKLFILVQLRVVSASEVRKRQSETITEKLIRKVAKEDFALVQPMIDALRTNDRVKLSRFGDLQPFESHIGQLIGSFLTTPSSAIPELAEETEMPPPVTGEALEQTLINVLLNLGVAADVAQAMAKAQVVQNPSGDPLEMVRHITSMLTIPRKKPVKKKPKPPPEGLQPEDDLRRLIREGKKTGLTAYEALLQSNIVRSPLNDFVA